MIGSAALIILFFVTPAVGRQESVEILFYAFFFAHNTTLLVQKQIPFVTFSPQGS